LKFKIVIGRTIFDLYSTTIEYRLISLFFLIRFTKLRIYRTKFKNQVDLSVIIKRFLFMSVNLGLCEISPHCQASKCISSQKTFNPKEAVAYIFHRFLNKAHVFHRECFMLDMCLDQEFLRTGVLLKCPYCGVGTCEENTYPNPQEVAKIGFFYHVQQGNIDAVRLLLRSGLISPELKEWASKKPKFAALIAESNFVKVDEAAHSISVDSSAPLPCSVVEPIGDRKPKKFEMQDLHRLRELTEEYIKHEPSTTPKQVQAYTFGICGDQLCLATIMAMIKKNRST
jgi:hypothetical protein